MFSKHMYRTYLFLYFIYAFAYSFSKHSSIHSVSQLIFIVGLLCASLGGRDAVINETKFLFSRSFECGVDSVFMCLLNE